MSARNRNREIQLLFFGHTVRIRSSCPEFLGRMERILSPFLGRSGPDHALASYQVTGSGPYRLSRGGEHLYESDRLNYVLEFLESDLLSLLIQGLPNHLLVHAGMVQIDGRTILLPAKAGSGKSTLVAALIRAGFSLGTDEMAVLGVADSKLYPFPKALNLKSPSLEVLGPLGGTMNLIVPDAPADGDRVHHVEVRPERILSPARGYRVDHIVFPRFGVGETDRIEPVARAAAIGEIAQLSFNHYRLLDRALDCLETLVRTADCYRLTFSDLEAAIGLVREMAEARALTSVAG